MNRPFGALGLIQQAMHWLRVLCQGIAVLAILMLFGVVAFNIVARLIFDLTGGAVNVLILGAIELSKYALLIAVFAAIPAMQARGLIRVDILSRSFPAWTRRVLDAFWSVLLFVFAMILAWMFAEEAMTAFSRGDETQDLRMPLWLFHAITTFECIALAVLVLGGVLGLADRIDDRPTIETMD